MLSCLIRRVGFLSCALQTTLRSGLAVGWHAKIAIFMITATPEPTGPELDAIPRPRPTGGPTWSTLACSVEFADGGVVLMTFFAAVLCFF
jgi:hypothetical protein